MTLRDEIVRIIDNLKRLSVPTIGEDDYTKGRIEERSAIVKLFVAALDKTDAEAAPSPDAGLRERLRNALEMICYLCKRLNPQHTGNPETCDCVDIAEFRAALAAPAPDPVIYICEKCGRESTFLYGNLAHTSLIDHSVCWGPWHFKNSPVREQPKETKA